MDQAELNDDLSSEHGKLVHNFIKNCLILFFLVLNIIKILPLKLSYHPARIHTWINNQGPIVVPPICFRHPLTFCFVATAGQNLISGKLWNLFILSFFTIENLPNVESRDTRSSRCFFPSNIKGSNSAPKCPRIYDQMLKNKPTKTK